MRELLHEEVEMRVEVYGRCAGSDALEALQRELCGSVSALLAAYPNDGLAYVICTAFVHPPFPMGRRYVFRSKLKPHPIMVLAVLDDMSAGVLYSIVVPADDEEILNHIRAHIR